MGKETDTAFLNDTRTMIKAFSITKQGTTNTINAIAFCEKCKKKPTDVTDIRDAIDEVTDFVRFGHRAYDEEPTSDIRRTLAANADAIITCDRDELLDRYPTLEDGTYCIVLIGKYT